MKIVTKDWLNSAQSDLDVIIKIAGIDYLTHQTAFHCQQAVEKSFKAIIEEYEIGFIKTHDLEVLLEKGKEHIDFEINHNYIRKLNNIYLTARYPADLGLMPNGKPSLEEASEFVKFSKIIYLKVKEMLERERK
ncbi:MAG: HEPN domain-containing protein [Bacteroidetes bacterium]|nr:HEPN domain-containing protein [Bacteroidota bacterium]